MGRLSQTEITKGGKPVSFVGEDARSTFTLASCFFNQRAGQNCSLEYDFWQLPSLPPYETLVIALIIYNLLNCTLFPSPPAVWSTSLWCSNSARRTLNHGRFNQHIIYQFNPLPRKSNCSDVFLKLQRGKKQAWIYFRTKSTFTNKWVREFN